MKRAFFFIGIIMLEACSFNKSQPVYFFDFSKEIAFLSQFPTAIKHLQSTNKEELVETSVDWQKELKIFENYTPLLSVIHTDYYKETYADKNKDIITYTAKDLSKNPKIIQITYENGEPVQLYYMIKEDSRINHSFKQLYYYPKKGYHIEIKEQIRTQQPLILKNSAYIQNPVEKWHGYFQIGEESIPVRIAVQKTPNDTIIQFINDTETITISNLSKKQDSVFIPHPYFNSGFVIQWKNNQWKGKWYNFSKKNYHIPFFAEKQLPSHNVNLSETLSSVFTGKWKTRFSPNTTDEYPAIGIFKTYADNKITGTFLTETGDYRFLEGKYFEDSLWLSSFDGAHVFLFKASLRNDTITGMFYSGTHWKEPWIAWRDESATLHHPDSITKVIDTSKPFTFSFKDTQGNTVSFPENNNSRLTIVQIMGTWCPNCLDESIYFSELYDKYHEKGLQIIALCFERSDNYLKEVKNIRKLKQSINASYPFLFAGKADKKAFSEKFPQISALKSYPTSIFLDENNQIIKIHTGFYGPGTGNYYKRYKEETEAFILQHLMAKK